MFDPNFDPLKQLEQLNFKVKELIEINNQSSELLRQVVSHLNKQTEAINSHDLQINAIHNRLRLLEVARQYENNPKDTNNS